MDVWLKSLPSEMSPEDSLPKAGFHRAFMGSKSAIIHFKKGRDSGRLTEHQQLLTRLVCS